MDHHRSAVAPLLLRCHTAIATLLHRYRTAIVPLSLRCCRSAAVALLSRCCRTGIAPVSLHCCSSAVPHAVATHSHRYRSTVAHLLSLLLSLRSSSCYRLCCRSVVAPLSHRCRSAVASVAPLPLLSFLLLQRYHCFYRSCFHSRSLHQEAASG